MLRRLRINNFKREASTATDFLEEALSIRLRETGLTSGLIQKILDSPDNKLAEDLVRMVKRTRFEETVSREHAQFILGESFVGIEEVVRHLKVDPTSEQIRSLQEIPFSEYTLKDFRFTHVLVPVFPLSIAEMGKRNWRLLGIKQGEVTERRKMAFFEEFAQKEGSLGWRLVRKTVLQNTKKKTWDEQVRYLSYQEEVPSAQVMVFVSLAYGISRGGKLPLGYSSVRTSTITNRGGRVVIGGNRALYGEGISIEDGYHDEARFPSVGLSTEVIAGR